MSYDQPDDSEQGEKQRPLQSANISIARWPDGWSVQGFIDKEKIGYAKCLRPTGLMHAVVCVLDSLESTMRRQAQKKD